MGIFKVKGYYFAIILLVIAALCQSLNVPFSALLLEDSSPFMAAGFMALGALIWGLISFGIEKKSPNKVTERKYQRKDFKWIAILCVIAVLGDSLLTFGLTMCQASSAALITSFDIVMTAIIALIILREKIRKRLWMAIVLITLGGITISAGSDLSSLMASPGLILIVGNCVCTGIFYCCLKKLAGISPSKILIIYQSFSVICEFILAFAVGEQLPGIKTILLLMLLGMVVYGVSNYLLMIATHTLGAAKCSSVMGLGPFIGSGLSFIVFQEQPSIAFFISFILLIPGFYLVIRDNEDNEKYTDTTASPPPIEKYHDIRNYLVAVGFLLGFATSCGLIISAGKDYLNISASNDGLNIAFVCIALLQIIIGCIVIVLRHRDLAGIVLLILGFSTALVYISNSNSVIIGAMAIMGLLLGFIMFLGKDRKKYFFSIMFFLSAASSLTFVIFDNAIIQTIMNAIIALYMLFLDIGYSGIIPQFPGTKILVEDETTDFSIVGSFVCYIIGAISVLPWMITYLFSPEKVSLDLVTNFFIVSGIVMGIVAIMVIFLGKENKFIGVVFLCVTIFLILSGFTTGVVNYIAGIIMFLTGVLCLFRKKSLLLVGIMCILYGISSFTSVLIYGESILVISQFVMQVITFVVATYLAIAVFSQNKKLPLF